MLGTSRFTEVLAFSDHSRSLLCGAFSNHRMYVDYNCVNGLPVSGNLVNLSLKNPKSLFLNIADLFVQVFHLL